MPARLQLAAATEAPRPPAPEPLLPPAVTLFALVDPGDGSIGGPDGGPGAGAREIEVTDDMVRAALDCLDCEAVTPYRDGARSVARPVARPVRTAEIIPFPGRRAR